MHDIEFAARDEIFQLPKHPKVEISTHWNHVQVDPQLLTDRLEGARSIFSAVGNTQMLFEQCSIEMLQKLNHKSFVAADIEAVYNMEQFDH